MQEPKSSITTVQGDHLCGKLEMSGNLTAIREMTGNDQKVAGKYCHSLKTEFVFLAIPVFSNLVCERFLHSSKNDVSNHNSARSAAKIQRKMENFVGLVVVVKM